MIGASHGFDDAAEFDQSPVAGALEHVAVLAGDRGVDEVDAQRPQPRERAVLVRARHAAEADNVGGQDRCDFAGLGHRAPPDTMHNNTKADPSRTAAMGRDVLVGDHRRRLPRTSLMGGKRPVAQRARSGGDIFPRGDFTLSYRRREATMSRAISGCLDGFAPRAHRPRRVVRRLVQRPLTMDFSAYEFSSLQEGQFTLHRGLSDRLEPILLVACSDEYPSPGSLQRLEHEHALRADLDAEWAARPVELVRREGRLTLVLEDPGGEPLERMLGRPMEMTQFLRIAVPLAAVIGRVHARGLIHKDLKPANILVDAASGSVRLTGFGIASRLPRERQAPGPPEEIAGTLAYMPPEQTGRMNRSVDSRSDLYSLGVTLYEMITGKLPFSASDPMEWIHCHIARQPRPPGELRIGIPGPVEAIILRLLAKSAEDRYQTAAGLEADLRRCLAEWEAHGRIEPFPLGMQDVSDRLLIPERLYGREREIDALLAAFDRVVADGATELVLVSGYSGIGKSSVVNELHKALVPPRGLFAAGKFDQYKRDIPYATLAQAFQSLVRHILGKGEVGARAVARRPEGGLGREWLASSSTSFPSWNW